MSMTCFVEGFTLFNINSQLSQSQQSNLQDSQSNFLIFINFKQHIKSN